MKKGNLIYLLLSLIVIMSCNKPDTIKNDFKKITVVRTNSGYSGTADSLIIELNNNSTIKSIKTYAFGIGKTISAQMIKNFVYQSNSTIIDSSVIETKDWMRPTDTFTEKYQYDNGKIVNISSPVFEIGGSNSLVTYTYNQEGKIVNKFTTYKYRQDTVNQHLNFEYIANNIYSSTDPFSSSLMPKYENKYIAFDDKINPLNELFRKCNFPVDNDINSFFPPEFMYSENNPTKMELNSININQTYKYNQSNYPIEVISNWADYNVRIYYE